VTRKKGIAPGGRGKKKGGDSTSIRGKGAFQGKKRGKVQCWEGRATRIREGIEQKGEDRTQRRGWGKLVSGARSVITNAKKSKGN